MADTKWITGLTPDLPLSQAARLVLPARLEAVLRQLPPAIRSAARDPEHVHQLRVATRRATAAVRLFADCLPRKHQRALRDCLRSVRRAAGAARDCDVYFAILHKAPALQRASARAAREFLFGWHAAGRCTAQIQLATIAGDESARLERATGKLSGKSFKWHDSGRKTAGALAVEQIGSLVDAFQKAATPPPPRYEQLHRLRILGKRLRYSMEVFAECFDAALRERLYPAMEEMQEILGRIADAHVATARFIEIREHVQAFEPFDWPRYRKPIEELLQAQRRVWPRERKRFVAWLANWKTLTSEWPVKSLVGR